MLQQTQVERVVPKYEAWLRAFPDWSALAAAKRSDVLRLWSGLGYNSRAVRLQLLAKIVFETNLPKTEHELQKMPGIGPYTAGAIMCFAFNKPGKCIDVNVARVIKRVKFSKQSKPTVLQVENELLALLRPAPRILANALMDLGSEYCTASNPKCDACPLRGECKSRGERPEEQAQRSKTRQKPFVGSNRWWRGQILKLLTSSPSAPNLLFRKIEKEGRPAFDKALNQLREEGLVIGVKQVKIKE
jgi:A/G-specific adenine glycosylase